MTLVNSVDTQGAILAVLTARKAPYVVALRAKSGVTEVAMFVLGRFDSTGRAQDEMYVYFNQVNSFVDVGARVDCKVHQLMKTVEFHFGDCSFSVVVEKMEV